MNEPNVVQLHRTLVDALRRTRPSALNRPVTVAEIYQDLVPYRTARIEIGFDMNADYEHALLRLLAGEGDLARIEPREVRDRLRMELESPNPNVGMFREYAACDVWVNVGDDHFADAAAESAEDDSWEIEFVGASEPADASAIQAALTPFEIEVPEPASKAADDVATPQEAFPDADAIACVYCGGELPDARMVNFCPYCGSDQSQQPCRSCGELLDPLWRFCVSCGAPARPLGDHLN